MSICLLTLNVEKEALPLGNDYWMCSYQSYDKSTSSFITEPPRNSLNLPLPLLHMLEFICIHILCYYTDTDSVLVSNPLPDDVIFSTILGKFKLEYHVKEGIFLAPKSYCLIPYDDKPDVIVHKGAAKEHVTREWFIKQYLLQ